MERLNWTELEHPKKMQEEYDMQPYTYHLPLTTINILYVTTLISEALKLSYRYHNTLPLSTSSKI